jgi:hypothetical protein
MLNIQSTTGLYLEFFKQMAKVEGNGNSLPLSYPLAALSGV